MARMAKARFSSGMPTTSDGSLIPRSNWELTKSLQLFLSARKKIYENYNVLGILTLNYEGLSEKVTLAL